MAILRASLAARRGTEIIVACPGRLLDHIGAGDIDLSNVADGTYEGVYDADLIQVKVAVEVKDHNIKSIDLLQHDNGKGAPAEAVIPEVIASQSLEVDTVSGATNSSKVILKSIEIAIEDPAYVRHTIERLENEVDVT